MQRAIIKDEVSLRTPSDPATAEDRLIAQDLLDTLNANKERCVGMAANMIGYAKVIIAVNDNGSYLLMFNPVIIKYSGQDMAEERCLSLLGARKTKRYHSIKVRYDNIHFQERIKTFKGFSSQIIQHEIDHCNGIVI